MKLKRLLCLGLLGCVLWGAAGCAPEAEPATPEGAVLTGVQVNSCNSTVYGEDFFISVQPDRIEALSVYVPEEDYREGENLPLADGEWAAIEAAVGQLTLEENLPQEPSLWEKLRSLLSRPIEVLDGGSETTLYLTWQKDGQTVKVPYYWPTDGTAAALWDVLTDLALSRADTLPLEED